MNATDRSGCYDFFNMRFSINSKRKEAVILVLFCLVLAGLCIGLWQKIGSITRPETHFHKHRHIVFQCFTSAQRDSIINKFYRSSAVLSREIWSGLSVYIIADSMNNNKSKMTVFFLEEDVPCPTCQDVYFLLELDNGGEIINNIHFVRSFESFSGWISPERMERFKRQLLQQRISIDFGKLDVITGATNSSRQFYRGLEHVRQALKEKGQNQNVQ